MGWVGWYLVGPDGHEYGEAWTWSGECDEEEARDRGLRFLADRGWTDISALQIIREWPAPDPSTAFFTVDDYRRLLLRCYGLEHLHVDQIGPNERKDMFISAYEEFDRRCHAR